MGMRGAARQAVSMSSGVSPPREHCLARTVMARAKVRGSGLGLAGQGVRPAEVQGRRQGAVDIVLESLQQVSGHGKTGVRLLQTRKSKGRSKVLKRRRGEKGPGARLLPRTRKVWTRSRDEGVLSWASARCWDACALEDIHLLLTPRTRTFRLRQKLLWM